MTPRDERAPETPATHDAARLALPWLASGTLEPEERKRVELHLSDCVPCREELAVEHRLREAVRDGVDVAPAPHPIQLARLIERIDAAEAGGPQQDGARARSSRLWRWLVAGQAAAILLLAASLVARGGRESSKPTFRTLSAAPSSIEPAAGMRIRVVFADTLDQRGVRELLLPLGAEIVSGPSPLGVYTIALSGERDAEPLAWVVAHLRAQPQVRFAEPVADGRP